MFPVWLNLEERRCLVVGGGGVALRKALALVDANARVTVVAPDIVPELATLADQRRITVERRPYRDGEAASGYAVVFAATDRREVNRRVSEDAGAAGIFVNVADDPKLCTFHLPGRVRRGSLEIAVASGGETPFLVRRLRQALDAKLGPEWAEWADAATAFRVECRARGLNRAQQEACFDRFVSGTLDRDRLAVRVPGSDEMQYWLGAAVAGDEVAVAPLPAPSADLAPGFVSLVGAGPGCPGLLTLRGRQRLMAADAVVYDRLAAGALPTDLPAHVELHGVGKESGHHPVPQQQINELLIRLAREGKRVVRLKGGDPCVFGRGGEEAEALEREGVAFEIVPGVTAGIAAPAFAGIPVTHRREAVQITLLTAHECVKDSGPQVRWDLIAQEPNATIVGYMGVHALASVVERLLAAGMNPATPAAVVEQGTTSAQQSVVATLESLPEEAARAGVKPPALFVFGPTVRHRDALDWAARQPLNGQRLAVPSNAVALADALELAGAEIVPVLFPVSQATGVVLNARPLTGCVVRSAAEVESFDGECKGAPWQAEWTGWCVGNEAAARATEHGWPNVRLLENGTENEIVAGIADHVRLRVPGNPLRHESGVERARRLT